MSLLMQAVIAAIIFAAGAAGGVKWQLGVQARKDVATLRQQAAAIDVRRTDIHVAATKYEAIKTAAEVRERIVEKEVERVVEKPVYTNSCLDADGLKILSDDIKSRDVGLPKAVELKEFDAAQVLF